MGILKVLGLEKKVPVADADAKRKELEYVQDARGYFRIGDGTGIKSEGQIVCTHQVSYDGPSRTDSTIIGTRAINILNAILNEGMASEPGHILYLLENLLKEEGRLKKGKANHPILGVPEGTINADTYARRKGWNYKKDGKGYFRIHLLKESQLKKEGNRIECTYYRWDSRKAGIITGTRATNILSMVLRKKLASEPTYLLYLARELLQAQEALEKGMDYSQDLRQYSMEETYGHP